MTTHPESTMECEALATWLAENPESDAKASGARGGQSGALPSSLPLPTELAAHVSECLPCYRFAAAWRELPAQEAALRKLLREDPVGPLAKADEVLDDAFWKELPGKVFSEVHGKPAADEMSVARAKAVEKAKGSHGAQGRRWLGAALGAAAAAALIVLAWPRAATHEQAGKVPHPAAAVAVSAHGETNDLPTSDEASWVGALAELSQQELTTLLTPDDAVAELGEQPTDLDNARDLQEMQEAWSNQLVSFDAP